MNDSEVWRQRWRTLVFILVLTPALILTLPASGQTGQQPPAATELRVGVSLCPPFVTKNAQGELSGMALELWELIAKELGVTYRLQEYEWTEMLEAIVAGEVDLAISCTTITSERETWLDFTHPFYEAHLTAATRKTSLLESVMTLILDLKKLAILAVVIAVSLVVGGGMWALEHEENDDFFPQRGIGGTLVEIFLCGFMFITHGAIHYSYWRSLPARVFSAIASFASTLMVATATALLASALTTLSLHGQIRTPEDLCTVRVAAFDETTASAYLRQNAIPFTPLVDERSDYDLLVLAQGRFDAVIGDKPVFEYILKQDLENGQFKDIVVLPWNLQTQSYGIALPQDSPWREAINREMLLILKSQEWESIVDTYLKY